MIRCTQHVALMYKKCSISNHVVWGMKIQLGPLSQTAAKTVQRGNLYLRFKLFTGTPHFIVYGSIIWLPASVPLSKGFFCPVVVVYPDLLPSRYLGETLIFTSKALHKLIFVLL